MTTATISPRRRGLVLNVGGVDDSSAQQLYARRSIPDAISAGSTATGTSPAFRRGRLLLDYTKFHDVVPEGGVDDGRGGPPVSPMYLLAPAGQLPIFPEDQRITEQPR